MENFQGGFIEEATDNINDLESALLLLEEDPANSELIERVFRAMHSLKGGGAMFGFDELSDFTHHMESVYDLVREGKLEVTRDLLNITLDSVDLMKKLLVVEDERPEEISVEHSKLVSGIKGFLVDAEENAPRGQVYESAGSNPDSGGTVIITYLINFVPDKDIMKNGTNPLYLIDELNSLGKTMVIANTCNIPELEKFDTSKCYISWRVFLSTSEDKNAISDVFMFVEDDCMLEIHKLGASDLLDDERFVRKIEECRESDSEIEINSIKDFAKSIKEEGNDKKSRQIKRKVANGRENTISSIRVSSDKIDQLMNLVSELVITQASLSLYTENSNNADLQPIAESVQKLTRQLRDNAFSISLIPLESMMTRFQRLVRDLSDELGKEINFSAKGTETELDKTIIESLTDPLLHIIRNAIDHGIESPDERKNKGKPANGEIVLKAFYSGANVIIEVSDDGAGIDPEKIRKKAIERQLITPDSALNDKELVNLLFLPGFSTAESVTDLSGRGVGMDVVKRKISSIRGEVDIESSPGKGTVVTVKLPLTLSIIDGLLVKIAGSQYVIPLSVVDKIFAVEHETIARASNNLVVLDGEQLPFYYLREEFGLDGKPPAREEMVVVEYENVRIGLATDSVVGEHQAVLKPLGKFYREQEIVSGGTILGDGSIALVLDTNKIINQFSNNNKIKEVIS